MIVGQGSGEKPADYRLLDGESLNSATAESRAGLRSADRDVESFRNWYGISNPLRKASIAMWASSQEFEPPDGYEEMPLFLPLEFAEEFRKETDRLDMTSWELLALCWRISRDECPDRVAT